MRAGAYQHSHYETSYPLGWGPSSRHSVELDVGWGFWTVPSGPAMQPLPFPPPTAHVTLRSPRFRSPSCYSKRNVVGWWSLRYAVWPGPNRARFESLGHPLRTPRTILAALYHVPKPSVRNRLRLNTPGPRPLTSRYEDKVRRWIPRHVQI